MIQLYREKMSFEGERKFHLIPGVQPKNIVDLILNLKEYLGKVDGDLENIFYSVHHSTNGNARTFEQCEYLYYDIDKIDKTKEQEYIQTVANLLQVEPIELTAIDSGNGIHILARLSTDNQLLSETQLEMYKNQYKQSIKKLEQLLKEKELPGKVDNVWDRARLLRVPGTKNIKQDKETKEFKTTYCKLIQLSEKYTNVELSKIGFMSALKEKAPENSEALSFAVQHERSLTIPEKENSVNSLANINHDVEETVQYPPPDTKAVLSGCGFIQHFIEDQKTLSEPEWYAGISILARLDNGRELVHRASQGYPTYSHRETERKIDQALNSAGPRTCENIDGLWSGCQGCPHLGKVTSPIQIKSEEYLATETTGFYTIMVNSNGATKYVPCFDDLIAAFCAEFHPKIISDSSDVFVYEDGKYSIKNELEITGWAASKMDPSPSSSIMTEFYKRLLSSVNLQVRADQINNYPSLLNMHNGILDLKTRELKEHSPEFLFTYKLDVNFEAGATAPMFKAWLQNLLMSEAKYNTVMEYFAYALSGTEIANDKFVVFTGEGANGKSTVLKLMRKLFGEAMSYSRPHHFIKFGKGVLMKAKLVTFEETPSDTEKMFWEELKDLSSGGVAVVDRKYKDTLEIPCRSKFLFVCNRLPWGSDSSHGFFRRFIIVKFRRRFTDAELQPNFEAQFFHELPGILNLLLEHLDILVKNDYKLTIPDDIKEATEEYRLEKDIVYQYANEVLQIRSSDNEAFIPDYKMDLAGEHIVVPVDKIYENSFVPFCGSVGINRPIQRMLFRKQLAISLRDMGLEKHFAEGNPYRRPVLLDIYPVPDC